MAEYNGEDTLDSLEIKQNSKTLRMNIQQLNFLILFSVRTLFIISTEIYGDDVVIR